MSATKVLHVFKNFIVNPSIRFSYLTELGLTKWMSDKAFIKKQFKYTMGYPLNLDAPKTYNEKLQWLKLYDRKPIYTTMVDKFAVKQFVSGIIGSQYLIPTIGVWDRADDIDFNSLPNQFVLKCTHDSGGLVICKDKKKLDKDKAIKKLNSCLKRQYFYIHREWPYKNVKPRIIAEQYMEDTHTHELRDYKFFCFDGEVKALFIASERQNSASETRFDFFDADFTHLPIKNGHPNADILPDKPVCFEEMKKLAQMLSAGIPHVRVDFYEVNGKVYFGELTFSHWSGFVPFSPKKWDDIFGEWIKLPDKK